MTDKVLENMLVNMSYTGPLPRWEWDRLKVSTYNKGVVVNHGSADYICIKDHQVGRWSEPGGGGRWRTVWMELENKPREVEYMVGAKGETTSLPWKGPWSDESRTMYNKHDTVEHGGTTFHCISPHYSRSYSEPGVGDDWPEYWERGADMIPTMFQDIEPWIDDSAKLYSAGNRVLNNSWVYRCRVEHWAIEATEPGRGLRWFEFWELLFDIVSEPEVEEPTVLSVTALPGWTVTYTRPDGTYKVNPVAGMAVMSDGTFKILDVDAKGEVTNARSQEGFHSVNPPGAKPLPGDWNQQQLQFRVKDAKS